VTYNFGVSTTLVDDAVEGLQDTVTQKQAEGSDLVDLTLASINELWETAGDCEVLGALLTQVMQLQRPFSVDTVMVAIRQAVLFAIEAYVPPARCQRILFEVWSVPQKPCY
jgi:hypothetical protein